MGARVYSQVIDLRGHNVGFELLRKVHFGEQCWPGHVQPLGSDEAVKHVLEMLRVHGEPVKILVPCHRTAEMLGRGRDYSLVRYYGDLYCELLDGFSCGYGGEGPEALAWVVAKYLGLETIIEDPDLYRAWKELIENREHGHAAILVELCRGKAYITAFRLG